MSSALVRLQEVSKTFFGRPAVERLSCELREGEVFALLGPNGAGKTTTVRMLVGILRPDEGRIEATLPDGGKRLAPHLVGYLPEDRGLYREVPILRTLIYFAMLRGLDRREARTRAHEWLERMGLLDRRHERLDALSKGNQQRVQLGTALLHHPRLAILDEPFSGLDPISQETFLELVRELRERGTAVLLSAHQMDLVERVADRFLLLNRGRTILAGSLEELYERLDLRPRLRLTLEEGADASALGAHPDVEEQGPEGEVWVVTLRRGAAIPGFLASAASRVALRGLAIEEPRLHDVFVRAVREDDARAGVTP